MSLSSSSWSNTLLTLMQNVGLIGQENYKFAGAVAEGSVRSLVGKGYAIAGTKNPGNGIGLTGVAPSFVSGLIITNSTLAFGGSGYALPLLAVAVENAMIVEILKASLKGTSSGAIVPGTISVSGAEWGQNIFQAGLSRNFQGKDWPTFANIIGQSCATGFSTVTGVLSGGGDPGAGKGTIS